LPSKPPSLLVLFVLLWRDSIIENFLFMLNHQDTTCQIVKQFEETGSVFDKSAKEHKCSISTCTEVVGEAQEAITEVQEQVCNF
jgi:predicted nucleic-acid-binding protein